MVSNSESAESPPQGKQLISYHDALIRTVNVFVKKKKKKKRMETKIVINVAIYFQLAINNNNNVVYLQHKNINIMLMTCEMLLPVSNIRLFMIIHVIIYSSFSYSFI